MSRTVVIGAGLCGLVAARSLRNQGVLVLEAGSVGGGVIRSEEREGYLLEHGPNTLALRPGRTLEQLEEIGLLDRTIDANPEASKRFIIRNGRLVAAPSSPPSLLATSLLTLGGKLRLLIEPFLPRGRERETESVAGFFRRRLGQEALDYAANPFVAGVYAARPETLVLRHAFPTLFDLETEHRSLLLGGIRAVKRRKRKGLPKTRLVSFSKGLATLPLLLASDLDDAIRLKAIARKVIRMDDKWVVHSERDGKATEEAFDKVVCSIPAHRLDSIEWQGLAEAELIDLLASAPHHPVAVLHHGFRREDIGHPLDGFGFLVPEKEGLRILGTLFSSTLFPGRAPDGHALLTTFVGGERQPDLPRLEEEALHDLVLEDLRPLLDFRSAPTFRNITRWPKAIPLPDARHDERLSACKRLQDSNPGLSFTGSHLTGVSLPACLEGASIENPDYG